MQPIQPDSTPLIFARWIGDEASTESTHCFMLDPTEGQTVSLLDANVVLMDGAEARAHQLLEEGVARVLLGDAALLDGTLARRLVEQYGGDRIGVAVTARKHHVSWTLDTVSNADFRCLTPSYGKPGWELVLSNGDGTGADAEWWLGEMFGCGASLALVRIDMQDDDLNACAGLVENYGEKLWFTPWQHPDNNLEPWVRYGQVRHLLLPVPNTRDANAMDLLHAAAKPETEISGVKVDDAQHSEERGYD